MRVNKNLMMRVNKNRFLQTIDDDGDSSNGINITSAMRTAIQNAGKTLVFDVSANQFTSDTALPA